MAGRTWSIHQALLCLLHLETNGLRRAAAKSAAGVSSGAQDQPELPLGTLEGAPETAKACPGQLPLVRPQNNESGLYFRMLLIAAVG